MNKMISLTAAVVLLSSMSALAQGKVEVPFFGNESCPVSGKPVDRKLSVKVGNERVYVCCKKCRAKVRQAPQNFLAKAYPKAKNKDLKNKKCPIMGGKAKESVTTVFQGHVIHFCCPGCDKKFMKEPNKNLAKLTSKKKLTELGNKTCIVMSNEKAEADSFVIYKGQIINICCAGCADDFAKNPKKYLADYKKRQSKGKKKDHDHSGHEH